MNFKQVTPCTEWFYVADSEGKGDVVIRLAAWALTSSQEVVGLIADTQQTGVPLLVLPPEDFPATYKHRRELNEWQCEIMGEKYEVD